ncbi:MAG: hypothetical protein PHR44_07310 [Candidatus Omnitrophica bacterium]|nr:hypothetical protein [Candidatus Omnitrophota bacterium]
MEHSTVTPFKTAVVILIVLGALALSLLSHWEISGEGWGYWLSARMFAESGRFVVLDRSPLYALYLNLFSWLGYPLSVTSEYFITTLITAIALIVLFRPYLGPYLSAFAVLLWIPFLQSAEPPVQKLALAFSCLAIAARREQAGRFRLASSYALFGLAYMFRCTYIIFIFIFVIWDTFNFLRQKGAKNLFAQLIPRHSDWPVILVMALSAYFIGMQSTHRWNNTSLFTGTWFPGDNKRLSDGAFIQNYNEEFIRLKYGTCADKDIYFTNREIFGGAATITGAIRANPSFVAGQVIRNIKYLVPIIAGMTEFPRTARAGIFLRVVSWLCSLFMVALVLYGAFRAVGGSRPMLLFLLGSILLVASTVISMPKTRYMVPVIPVFIIGASWYGANLRNAFSKNKMAASLGCLAVPIMLFFFSNADGYSRLRINLIKDLVKDVRQGDLRLMQNSAYPMKASFEMLGPLVRDCRGIMSLEHTFIGAFMELPLDRVYDIWEIPPFGSLETPHYNGLRPERVDCVLVSRNLAENSGCATNFGIRYRNYIKPYVKLLQKQGAGVYEIPGLGTLVKLGGD